jgi:hypothetical protein
VNSNVVPLLPSEVDVSDEAMISLMMRTKRPESILTVIGIVILQSGILIMVEIGN